MMDSAHFAERVEASLRSARRAGTPEERRAYLQIAESWRRLANTAVEITKSGRSTGAAGLTS